MPTFEPVRKLDFYVAKVVRSSFRIAKKDEPAAFAALKKHFDGDSLDAIFKENGTPLVRDPKKSIVNVKQGGDEWAFELIAKVAKFAKGEFVLVDDVERRYEARIEDGKLRYFAETLAKDWRKDAKRDREQLEKLLKPMGFALDKKTMLARKKDIEEYWGEAARAEIDPDVPFMIFRKKVSDLKLEVEYASHATSHSVNLSMTSMSPYGHFALSIPTKYGLPAIVDGIAVVQHGFARFDAVYAELKKRFRAAKVVSEGGAFTTP